jgi:hypothetical protein
MKKSRVTANSIAIAATFFTVTVALGMSSLSINASENCRTEKSCPPTNNFALLSDGSILPASQVPKNGEELASLLTLQVGADKKFFTTRNAQIENYSAEYLTNPPAFQSESLCVEGWICLDTGQPLVLDDGTILLSSILDDGTRKVVGELNVADVRDPEFTDWVAEQNRLIGKLQASNK